MQTRTYNFSVDLTVLVELQTKLNTPPAVQLPELDGMFHRVQDFTLSHANLNTQFTTEYRIACIEFPKSKDTGDLMNNVSSHMTMSVHSLGEDHFTSRELSPALRHFVNDSCRLLEPIAPLLAAKFPDITLAPRQSLDSYTKKLLAADKALDFDTQFIIELYELWNDYKHRETTGLFATPWNYKSDQVIKAGLALPSLPIDIHKLNNLSVDDFANLTTQKILKLLGFVI